MTDGTFEPDWFSRPGDTIHALMGRQGLSAADLGTRLGCSFAAVRNILAGSAPIDEALAGKLAETIGGTTHFWHRRQATYDRCLSRAADAVPATTAQEWLKQLPVNTMASLGWIEPTADRAQALRSCLAYFGVVTPEEWRHRYAVVNAGYAFRTSPSFESNLGPLSAWLRQAEIEASMRSCAKWNPDGLQGIIHGLRKLTLLREPSKFLPRLQSMCADVGVALIILKAPKGCRASGATRMVSSNQAMVVLSFRHLSEDHFWFTFFHEMGHLLLHRDETTFVDLDDDNGTDQKEREANNFAATTLVPLDRYEEMTMLNGQRQSIMRFAASLGISPGIVVGQMQHQGLLGPANLNFLKRRYTWDDINAALS